MTATEIRSNTDRHTGPGSGADVHPDVHPDVHLDVHPEIRPVTRAEVEDLLFEEAALLDDWKLEQWLALYTDDATYHVPSTDLPADADPGKSLFYIADDRMRMQQRVIRLMKRSAHSEFPRSRTRHLVSNVRLLDASADPVIASAGFATYRTKNGHTDTYVGALHYRLRRSAAGLRIAAKRCVLDLDGLRPHGRISIIL